VTEHFGCFVDAEVIVPGKGLEGFEARDDHERSDGSFR